jgi:hypothetical protein
MSESETVFLDEQFQEIRPQRSVSADSFTAGSILFNFNVSGLNSINMNKSFFIIESKLTGIDSKSDRVAHKLDDRVTYAHNWASCLFSNVGVRVSGQEVSVCNQYNHLAHTVKMRQMIDENLLNTNFRDMMDYDIDFTRRLNKHCGYQDTSYPQREDSMLERGNAGNGETEEKYQSWAIRSGDTKRYTFYQPVNLGVFDLQHGELCGDISIMLNPNPSYEKACVESAVFDATGDFKEPTYKLTIESIVFMACYAKATKPIDAVKTFTIHEYAVQNKAYAPQLEFQVLPSTEQITVFIQDPAAGTNTSIPATFFKVRQFTKAQVDRTPTWAASYGKQFTQDENGALQVTLGNTTKPPIMLEPSTNMPNVPAQKLRWLMSHMYGNVHGHKNLYERYDDWCASPYHCFDFMRDSSDTSGFVTVRSNYTLGGYPGQVKQEQWSCVNNPLLFCVSKYSRVVQITYNSGYVTDIKIQNA